MSFASLAWLACDLGLACAFPPSASTAPRRRVLPLEPVQLRPVELRRSSPRPGTPFRRSPSGRPPAAPRPRPAACFNCWSTVRVVLSNRPGCAPVPAGNGPPPAPTPCRAGGGPCPARRRWPPPSRPAWLGREVAQRSDDGDQARARAQAGLPVSGGISAELLEQQGNLPERNQHPERQVLEQAQQQELPEPAQVAAASCPARREAPPAVGARPSRPPARRPFVGAGSQQARTSGSP